MSNDAFVGGLTFRIGAAGSPTSFTDVCPVISVSGVGKTNELVDTTTFCSGGVREYVGGLADGTEVTIDANYETNNTELDDMITAVENKQTRDIQLYMSDGTNGKTYTFRAAFLGWTVNPSIDDRNTITYTAKISGDIVSS